MSLEWEQVVVASRDPVALGRWWSEALRWVIVNNDPVVFEIQPEPDRLPGILFLAVDEAERRHHSRRHRARCRWPHLRRRRRGERCQADLPASISFGVGATEGTLYAVNLANVEAFSTGFGPAFVAIDVDLPR